MHSRSLERQSTIRVEETIKNKNAEWIMSNGSKILRIIVGVALCFAFVCSCGTSSPSVLSSPSSQEIKQIADRPSPAVVSTVTPTSSGSPDLNGTDQALSQPEDTFLDPMMTPDPFLDGGDKPKDMSKEMKDPCEDNERGTKEQEAAYAKMLKSAIQCSLFGKTEIDYIKDGELLLGSGLRLDQLAKLSELADGGNYGCFCGKGNTGLNTKPVDAIDSACKKHDLNLWAICQNTDFKTGDKPCNCYENAVELTCSDKKEPVIKNEKDLNSCQKICARDAIEMATEINKQKKEFNTDRVHKIDLSGGPKKIDFEKINYCKETEDSKFNIDGFGTVKAPDNWLQPSKK
jgi:hypothetical protein